MGSEPTFRHADEDEQALFDKVRDKWHPDIDGYELALIFRDIPQVIEGRNVAATANVAKQAKRFLTGIDGWVEVCETFWGGEGEEWQEYLIDHELSHFTVTKRGLSSLGHSFEDFEEVLSRHDPAVTGAGRLARIAGLSENEGDRDN